MKVGSNVVVDGAVGEFIERMGNLAMVIGVCAVCARETPLSDLGPQRLDTFPNPSRLRPATAHPAQDLFNGMLLHPPGLLNSDKANVCVECNRALKMDKIPPLALANGL